MHGASGSPRTRRIVRAARPGDRPSRARRRRLPASPRGGPAAGAAASQEDGPARSLLALLGALPAAAIAPRDRAAARPGTGGGHAPPTSLFRALRRGLRPGRGGQGARGARGPELGASGGRDLRQGPGSRERGAGTEAGGRGWGVGGLSQGPGPGQGTGARGRGWRARARPGPGDRGAGARRLRWGPGRRAQGPAGPGRPGRRARAGAAPWRRRPGGLRSWDASRESRAESRAESCRREGSGSFSRSLQAGFPVRLSFPLPELGGRRGSPGRLPSSLLKERGPGGGRPGPGPPVARACWHARAVADKQEEGGSGARWAPPGSDR